MLIGKYHETSNQNEQPILVKSERYQCTPWAREEVLSMCVFPLLDFREKVSRKKGLSD